MHAVRRVSKLETDCPPLLTERADQNAAPAAAELANNEPASEDDHAPLTPESAMQYLVEGALRACAPGPVGLELEGHLVARPHPDRRPSWASICAAVDALPLMPGSSLVTVEPGGQVELSTPPADDVTAAITALRQDREVLAGALSERDLGVAYVGADPARPPARVNPASRYTAMEDYFDVAGHGAAGRAMMCSTASVQVNIEAGPTPAEWARRVSQVHRLGPVLVAMSACSPALSGVLTGWRSSRQQVWGALDPSRCAPLRGGDDPAVEWAHYALQAPVMLVNPHPGAADAPARPMRAPVSFRAWLSGEVPLDHRGPTAADLRYHLTTLFPPVRLRGFLEIRYLDAVPDRWWPALAAVTALLVDDPAAFDAAAQACEPVTGEWTTAARDGLGDQKILAAARACVHAASLAAPPTLRPAVDDFAALIDAGRSPGDDVLESLLRTDPVHALWEQAHA